MAMHGIGIAGGPGIAALVALALLPGQAGAVPLGNLRQFQALTAAEAGTEAPTAWVLRTDAGMRVRISLLRADVVRIEAGVRDRLQPPGDKAAPIVLPAARAAVPYQLDEQADRLQIRTAALALRIYRKPLRFELDRVAADGALQPLWRELQPLELGRDASVQTLSSDAGERFFGGGQQNGRFEFKGRQLEVSYSGGWDEGDRPNPAPFLLSSRGWGMLRNTWSDGGYDLRQPDRALLQHREERFDAYYFVGPTLREALDRYTELTGRARLLPRWGYEYGDADCYNDGDNGKKPGTVPAGWSDGPTGTTPDVIASVAEQYRRHDMPGGWILPNDGYGCGYTDLPQVVQGLRRLGFRTGLWTEDGVGKIAWEVGQAGTRVQKLDVAWTGQGYQFAMDANQSAADGILQNSDSRPFVWTVMGWAGIQRHAVAWTGDQSGSWDFIRWHIPTLVGSGLSGMAYATGDVDGIFGGSPETYTRDLQWKAFTPVLMGMSGWSAAVRKHPWWFDEPYRSLNRDALKLRMRLMPYLYTLARETEQTGAPMVRGLMWDHPADPHAFGEDYKQQFFLGRDFLVAPVFRSQAASGGWRRGVYLPEGRWIDYRDGRVVDAGSEGRLLDYAVTLETLPVFVRAGAIVPMYPAALYDGQVAKDALTWDLYPQGRSSYTLYEDDGETRQYRDGRFSSQTVAMSAPADGAGDIAIALGAVQGDYRGQEARRAYRLQIHSRARPLAVSLQGGALPQQASREAFEAAAQGWFFDAADRYGTLLVKTAPVSIRDPLAFAVRADPAAGLAATAGYPAAPELGRALPADSLAVVGRPPEEAGHPLENALDDQAATWFKSKRDAAAVGPHEFVLSLGERRLLDGFEIAPRTDEHWKYGLVKDFELYLADRNGDWGSPAVRGRLARRQGVQTVDFAPRIGRLLRFRVISTYDAEAELDEADGGKPADPVPAAVPAAYDALQPDKVAPITLSTFRLLEHRPAARPEQQRYLSEARWLRADSSLGAVARDRAAGAASPMRMNGLQFRRGLGVGGSSRIDFRLRGDWQRFRADVGIDDRCRGDGGLHFQVWGDGRLLFDSGRIEAPAVVKPELDIRGIGTLSLRTTGATGRRPARLCANWANPLLVGLAGDRVGDDRDAGGTH
ncbi:NPCBM/NEW2 domain-containing protein [Chitinimonas koreensis]|uniref:NPCBM/NEW2 domain-containing protein n=1 Tax=Chitinimonas koreensis TaxID=356302 RepID=UPI0004254F5E|nr:TIM-barrel domain-containing protein [Chitinimonas koreensis]